MSPWGVMVTIRGGGELLLKMDNPISCALDMARRAWPGLRSYPLVAFAQSHGMDTRGQHRTLKECARTLLIYYAAATQLGGVD